MYLQVTKEIKAWKSGNTIHVFNKSGEYCKTPGFVYIEEDPTYERVIEFCNQYPIVCGYKITLIIKNMMKTITRDGVVVKFQTVDTPIYVTYLEKFINKTQYRFDLVNAFMQGKNITCSAVAGSGKTTSLLDLCDMLPEQTNVVILTYNKRLQLDIDSRLETDSKVKAYTFHGYAGKVFGEVVRNDDMFMRCMENAVSASVNEDEERAESILGKYIKPKTKIDILMVDEAQDLTDLYANFVNYIGKGAQLILMGDPNQAINTYKGANTDYLLNPEMHFSAGIGGDDGIKFVHCTLPYSYRLTPQMSQFVNNHIFRRDVIVGINQVNNKKPLCLVASSLKDIGDSLTKSVKGALKKFSAQDILILMPSTYINQNSYYSILGEFLKEMKKYNIPVDIDNWTDATGIGILNFASCKGYQRPCVIVVGMDESYFKYYNRDFKSTSDELIPNVLNVVATRAANTLVLICNKQLLRSFNVDKMDDLVIQGEYESAHIIETNYVTDTACYVKSYFTPIILSASYELVIEQLINAHHYGVRTIVEACQDAPLIQCKISGRETDICKTHECDVSHGVVASNVDKLLNIISTCTGTGTGTGTGTDTSTGTDVEVGEVIKTTENIYHIVRSCVVDVSKLTRTYSKYGKLKIIDLTEGCIYNL